MKPPLIPSDRVGEDFLWAPHCLDCLIASYLPHNGKVRFPLHVPEADAFRALPTLPLLLLQCTAGLWVSSCQRLRIFTQGPSLATRESALPACMASPKHQRVNASVPWHQPSASASQEWVYKYHCSLAVPLHPVG